MSAASFSVFPVRRPPLVQMGPHTLPAPFRTLRFQNGQGLAYLFAAGPIFPLFPLQPTRTPTLYHETQCPIPVLLISTERPDVEAFPIPFGNTPGLFPPQRDFLLSAGISLFFFSTSCLPPMAYPFRWPSLAFYFLPPSENQIVVSLGPLPLVPRCGLTLLSRTSRSKSKADTPSGCHFITFNWSFAVLDASF